MLDQVLRAAMRVGPTLAMADEPLDPDLDTPVSSAIESVLAGLRGGWPIDRHLGTVLANAVVRKGCRSVLEFGAGSSSVLLATALDEAGGGRITSIEQDPAWCTDRWALVERMGSVDALLVTSTPARRFGRLGVYAYHAEAEAAVEARSPFDLVLVDAPQSHFGREGAVPLVYDHLSEGALVVLDDARRPGEQWAICKWLKAYPGLRLIHYDADFGKKGLAILRREANVAPRFSPQAFVFGALQGFRRAAVA